MHWQWCTFQCVSVKPPPEETQRYRRCGRHCDSGSILAWNSLLSVCLSACFDVGERFKIVAIASTCPFHDEIDANVGTPAVSNPAPLGALLWCPRTRTKCQVSLTKSAGGKNGQIYGLGPNSYLQQQAIASPATHIECTASIIYEFLDWVAYYICTSTSLVAFVVSDLHSRCSLLMDPLIITVVTKHVIHCSKQHMKSQHLAHWRDENPYA